VDSSEVRNRIEQLISEGKLHEAEANLKAINYDKLPRSQIADFANFARRIGSPELTLRVLHHVREPRHGEEPATPSEVAAYAMALGKTGATAEALRLFDTIRGAASAPEADLYLAFTLINQWEYRDAIPLLESYLERKEPTEYQKTVAKLNLAASCVFTGKTKMAGQLIKEIRTATEENGWTRLQMNVLELNSQLILQAEMENGGDQSENLLAEAFELAKKHQLDTLVLEKWKAVLALRSAPENTTSLESVREKAIKLGRWETVRDCDFQLALIINDPALMSKVFFGTPFPAFRKRIIAKSKSWFHPAEFYDWQLLASEPAKEFFDLKSGGGLSGLILQLMRGLSTDFYRPLHVGNLHSLVYPDDYFNPIHSPPKVKNLVTRLHSWFGDNNLPLRVTSKDMTYRLVTDDPYCIRVYLDFEINEDEKVREQLSKLRARWPYKSFSSAEAASELKITAAESLTLLKEAVTAGRLYRSGQGRSSVFRFRK
jgi:hypothetical protein